MYLPDELVLEILPNLQNIELKAARLVCKRWSCYAAKYLFAKIFISLDRVNLDVFRSVCQHPLLSKYVRHLQYDRLRLEPHVELSAYASALLREAWNRLQYTEQGPIESDDAQRTKFFSIVINALRGKHDRDYHDPPAFRRGAKEKCMNFGFVRNDYQHYVTQVELQKRYIDGTDIESIVVDGLKSLDHLDAVTISDAGLHPTLGTGSLLARSWKSQSDWPSCVFVSSPAIQEYSTITVALSEAHKHIHHLKTECTIKNSVFDVMTNDSTPHQYHYINAYSGLKTLHLTLELEYPFSRNVPYLSHIHGMLQSMSGLRDLRLAFHRKANDLWRFCMYDTAIFPEVGRWTQLTELRIENMTFRTKALMELIVLRMPSLQQLTLSGVNLREKYWEGIFEFLHRANFLQSLELLDDIRRCLFSGGKQWYHWGSNDDDDFGDLSAVERDGRDDTARMFQEYVVGSQHNPAFKHPSLRSHQPREESQKFLTDIFRHCEVESGGAKSELVMRMNELIEGPRDRYDGVYM